MSLYKRNIERIAEISEEVSKVLAQCYEDDYKAYVQQAITLLEEQRKLLEEIGIETQK